MSVLQGTKTVRGGLTPPPPRGEVVPTTCYPNLRTLLSMANGYKNNQKYNLFEIRRLITLTTKDTEETVRDAQSCAPSRFENFLRDGGQHRLVYCGKGLDVVATAIFKAKSKNAGIGDRSGDLVARARARYHGIQICGRTVNLPSAPAFSAARLRTQ